MRGGEEEERVLGGSWGREEAVRSRAGLRPRSKEGGRRLGV